jgi:hypothetical protein
MSVPTAPAALATATFVFDAADPTGKVHPIYRCGLCLALVRGVDAEDHFSWHTMLLHAPSAR